MKPKVKIGPIKKIGPVERPGKGDIKYKVQTKTENVKRVNIPISDRVEMSQGVRAWKLDESGAKTDKKSTIKVIRRIMQPPAAVNK